MAAADATEVYHRMHKWYHSPERDALRAAWGAYPRSPGALQAWPGFVTVTNAFLDSDAADDRPAAAATEPVAAEAESEPVGASEVVAEVMERETPAEAAADEPRGWLSSLLGPRREGGAEVDAEADKDSSDEDSSYVPDDNTDDEMSTSEDDSDAEASFKREEKKKKKRSPTPEELDTGPRDDGLLSTGEISGDYSAACDYSMLPIGICICCRSMTVVPLGADAIEVRKSCCIGGTPYTFLPCGPVADGNVRTREPGTNKFNAANRPEKWKFSADGTVKIQERYNNYSSFMKRPGSQKRTFQKVETRDLAGTWCSCNNFCPLVPFWPFSFISCSRKKALDEDRYAESGIACFLCLPCPICGTHTRRYVNGHPTNGFDGHDCPVPLLYLLYACARADEQLCNEPRHDCSPAIHWHRDPGCATALENGLDLPVGTSLFAKKIC